MEEGRETTGQPAGSDAMSTGETGISIHHHDVMRRKDEKDSQ